MELKDHKWYRTDSGRPFRIDRLDVSKITFFDTSGVLLTLNQGTLQALDRDRMGFGTITLDNIKRRMDNRGASSTNIAPLPVKDYVTGMYIKVPKARKVMTAGTRTNLYFKNKNLCHLYLYVDNDSEEAGSIKLNYVGEYQRHLSGESADFVYTHQIYEVSGITGNDESILIEGSSSIKISNLCDECQQEPMDKYVMVKTRKKDRSYDDYLKIPSDVLEYMENNEIDIDELISVKEFIIGFFDNAEIEVGLYVDNKEGWSNIRFSVHSKINNLLTVRKRKKHFYAELSANQNLSDILNHVMVSVH